MLSKEISAYNLHLFTITPLIDPFAGRKKTLFITGFDYHLHIQWSRLPKDIFPTSATTADYHEERQYRSQEEGSRYGLDLKINQLP
jgi:hypothetical protein